MRRLHEYDHRDADNTVRPLRSIDIEPVIAIDLGARRRAAPPLFREAVPTPHGTWYYFVHVGVVRNGALVGFAFVRILRGALVPSIVIDAVGVGTTVGRALMEGLTENLMREKALFVQPACDCSDCTPLCPDFGEKAFHQSATDAGARLSRSTPNASSVAKACWRRIAA